ncbi:MAG: DUF1062 domain-containing protein [Eggerthellaceae bacterium]
MEATAAPVALRPCGTCGADAEFASTGLFRVNAQKKRLDVWLIYRCATCGSVWNSAVISRGRPGSIDREELERFTGNDPVMALWCALDVSLLGQRRARARSPSSSRRPATGGEDCRVEIDGGDLAGLRLAEVLRVLGVSRSGRAPRGGGRRERRRRPSPRREAPSRRRSLVRGGASVAGRRPGTTPQAARPPPPPATADARPLPMFHVKHSFAHRWGATVGVCYHDGEHSGHAKEPSCTD